MTTQPIQGPTTLDAAALAAEQPPKYVPVEAAPDSRLDQLLAAYADLKPTVDAAQAELRAVTDAIKLELTTAQPEATAIEARAGDGRPNLRLTYADRVTFDSKKFKVDNPELYVRYAKFGGAWSLRAV